jgi:hypothetical protein
VGQEKSKPPFPAFPTCTSSQICGSFYVTEERVRHSLRATILAARRLMDMDPNKPNMAKGFFVDRAIDDAVFILERIDARWPSNPIAAKD